jgi:hypothetical protein
MRALPAVIPDPISLDGRQPLALQELDSQIQERLGA